MVRWGIIGCGDVTEVKSGPAFAKAQRSSLVAVMRRTAALARDYADRHGVPRWYNRADALVHDREVDAVYVATPPNAHLEHTLLCAQAGKPVYVEKPMALDGQECGRMVEACRDRGVPLFVAYYRRALPRFLEIERLLAGDAIGEIRAFTISLCRRHELPAGPPPWRVDPAIAGGGLFVDLASHMLDLVDFYLGPIAKATGAAVNQGGHYAAEDLVSAEFELASGVRGSGLWCFTAHGAVDRTEIIGSRGRITYATFDDRPILLETPGGEETLTIPHPAHVQQPLIQTVVDALHGDGACPSTGETAARTSRVMDQLLRSYYEGQAPGIGNQASGARHQAPGNRD